MRKRHRLLSAGLLAVGLLAVAAGRPAVAREPPTALPLEVAYSRREVPRDQRPLLSPDGRRLAYEIFSHRLKTPESGGDIEGRFLPNGLPADYAGLRLWVSDVEDGKSRPVCAESVTCWRGSWSPDGRRLAFYSDEGGEIGLWIFPVASGAARRVGSAVVKAKLWPGDEAVWSPDGATLFVPIEPIVGKAPAAMPVSPPTEGAAGATQPSVKVYRTAEAARAAGVEVRPPVEALNAFFLSENNATLAAVDAETGAVRVVVAASAEPRPGNLRLSPDGRWLSYLSVYRLREATSMDTFEDLVVVPAAGGDPVAVVRDIAMPDGDYFGNTYRWTPDSKRIVFLQNQDLWIAAIPNGSPRRLGESLGKIAESPLLLSADGKSVLVGLQAEGEKIYYSLPPRALALVPLDGGAPQLVEVSGEPVRADPSALFQTSPGTFALIRDVAGAAQREVVEVEIATGKTHRLWSGQGRFDVVGALPGGEGVVSRFEGLETPPDYFLFDRRFHQVRRLSEAEPRLAQVRFGPMESFESVLPGHDGRMRTVRTHVFLPPGGRRGDRLPTIVYFYSGSPFSKYAQDYGGGAPNSIPVQIFASRGYAVLFCDVPMGPSDQAGNPIQEMTDAVLAQVYRAADLGYSDIDRLAIMGQSYGGYSTAAIVTQTQLFRAAMALDGMYDLGSVYGWMDRAGGSANFVWAESSQGRMGTHPWANLQRYVMNSPYYLADKIHTPLLLIHGRKDDACPVQEAEKMFNALKRLEREAELAVYDGEGHVPGEWALVNAVDASQRMLDFLARHLGQ